ncbi:MAG: glycine betaine/proline transport system ATP-binding protein, partial [Bermanella sp.]
NGYCLSKKNGIWLSNDQKTVRYNNESLAVHHWQTSDDVTCYRSMPVCVPVDMPIRDVMEIRYLTGYPVLIRDGDQMTGLIGDRELYHTLLGKMLSDDD